MNTPEPDSIKRLLEQASEIQDPAEREAFLENACGNDTGLLAAVRALLEAASQAEDLFHTGDSVPLDSAQMNLSEAGPIAEGPGTLIGKHQLMQKIGEEGFGVVYMAEQRQPSWRRVALSRSSRRPNGQPSNSIRKRRLRPTKTPPPSNWRSCCEATWTGSS